jgi:ketosteroid isomerase-like protein
VSIVLKAAVKSDIDAIRGLLQLINQSWMQGRPHDIGPLLDDNVIFIYPGFAGRAQGRAAAVATYEDFLAQAKVHGVQLSEPEIDVFGDTAVATYRYEVDYEVSEGRFRDSGRDVFVFTCSDEGVWRAVWRTMIADNVATVEADAG